MRRSKRNKKLKNQLRKERAKTEKMWEQYNEGLRQKHRALKDKAISNALNEALVAVILRKCGATSKETAVVITTEEVGNAQRDMKRALVELSESKEIRLWSEE